jgi:hypothetical protein
MKRGDGGFDGSIRARMSPGTQRPIAMLEQAEAARDRAEAVRRQVRSEAWQQAALESAIQDAVQRGEDLAGPRRLRHEALGHTPAEFVALVSAQQDHEDALAAGRERQAFRKWQAKLQADLSADVTAPTQAEVAAKQLTASRAKKQAEEDELIQTARMVAAMDRGVPERRVSRGMYR